MSDATPISAEVAQQTLVDSVTEINAGLVGQDGDSMTSAIQKASGFPEEIVEEIIEGIDWACQNHPQLGAEGNSYHALLLGIMIGRKL